MVENEKKNIHIDISIPPTEPNTSLNAIWVSVMPSSPDAYDKGRIREPQIGVFRYEVIGTKFNF